MARVSKTVAAQQLAENVTFDTMTLLRTFSIRSKNTHRWRVKMTLMMGEVLEHDIPLYLLVTVPDDLSRRVPERAYKTLKEAENAMADLVDAYHMQGMLVDVTPLPRPRKESDYPLFMEAFLELTLQPPHDDATWDAILDLRNRHSSLHSEDDGSLI